MSRNFDDGRAAFGNRTDFLFAGSIRWFSRVSGALVTLCVYGFRSGILKTKSGTCRDGETADFPVPEPTGTATPATCDAEGTDNTLGRTETRDGIKEMLSI